MNDCALLLIVKFDFKVNSFFEDLLDLLPKVICLSPKEVLTYANKNLHQPEPKDRILMDKILLRSDLYQRPYQYLKKHSNKEDLDEFTYEKAELQSHLVVDCLRTLLNYHPLSDPSWADLSNFSKFLNQQLYDCESSGFVETLKTLHSDRARANNTFRKWRRKRTISKSTQHDNVLTGFKQFVVRFVIKMAQDFATTSLQNEENASIDEDEMLESHQVRRRWENNYHPYLFFNADEISLSFINFNINDEGDLCDAQTNEIIEKKIMGSQLLSDLKNINLTLQQNFCDFSREKKLEILCKVLNVPNSFDPDPSYELSIDNVLKILNIHMRFRCGIPVIIMGETGCGKTRLIQFMSKLKSGESGELSTMRVLRIHGGISVLDIQNYLEETIELCRNTNETILFLDEANTSEAIYAIKEIICDGSVRGKALACENLKIVAACNPYRKKNPEAIERMKKSGLGFLANIHNVSEKFGEVPMRHLVYRVLPLPPSLHPLVWDFGQLNFKAETAYIKQMVKKLPFDLDPVFLTTMTDCLLASQKFMREERHVCTFVSLRDVERSIQVFKWFYERKDLLAERIATEKLEIAREKLKSISWAKQALIQTLGVCYHVTLEDGKIYRKIIAEKLCISDADILNEITSCQNCFLKEIALEEDIGRNDSLRENAFMMIVCVEMRIPLFLIGKPGSSKSLAKAVVTDAMQGRNSKNPFFNKLKQIHVASFQCSAQSDAVGIKTVFDQCARLQKSQNPDEFVAVVVLDEIGLAEDSSKMPLKVLHSLLDNTSNCIGQTQDPHSKVGFVGISNWALDPAKLNRGIFVTRCDPSVDDLEKTALALFKSDKQKFQAYEKLIKCLTQAYSTCYSAQEKEFYGLRDYYGLLKMLFHLVSQNNDLFFESVAKLVLRNFSGYKLSVFHYFQDTLGDCFDYEQVHEYEVSVTQLIQDCVYSDFQKSRFLLLLTNHYAAVDLLPKTLKHGHDWKIIFGSSFPLDNNYTEICRNINKIKVCMESGRTVVLLNLHELYESLYDALNQYYVKIADQHYVDLGLGGHRLKCRISKQFRLIVVEEKSTVYEAYPIPLINRLEKHVLELSSVLSNANRSLKKLLRNWVVKFARIESSRNQFCIRNVFPGYTSDTPASALLAVEDGNLESAKKALIQSASIDGVCRLSKSCLELEEVKMLQTIYMKEQQHDSLLKLLQQECQNSEKLRVFQITSFSQMLNETDRQFFEKNLDLTRNSIMLLTLLEFKTKQSYSARLKAFFNAVNDSPNSFHILLIQCPQAQIHSNLIACAKYETLHKISKLLRWSQSSQNSYAGNKTLVIFLFLLERKANLSSSDKSFTTFYSQDCKCVFIDEIKPPKINQGYISLLWNQEIFSMSEAIKDALEHKGSNNRLDLYALIKICIPVAMVKVNGNASTKKFIKDLDRVCFQAKFSGPFFEKLVQHLIQLFRSGEQQKKLSPSWIKELACESGKLQEAGSFKQALWLHFREFASIALAKIISLLNADNNLKVLENSEFSDVWLEIFDNYQIFDLSWPDHFHSAQFNVPFDFECSFPFFRTIYEQLNKTWTKVKERKLNDKYAAFMQMLPRKTRSLLQFVTSRTYAEKLIEKFIEDLTVKHYKPSSKRKEDELYLIQKSVLKLFQAFAHSGDQCNAIAKVFILFKQIQAGLFNFSSLVAVSSNILDMSSDFIESQKNTRDFVLPKAALTALLKLLDEEFKTSISCSAGYQNWKQKVNGIKGVASLLVPLLTEDIDKLMWSRIIFIDMFLDQLLHRNNSMKYAEQYFNAVRTDAKILFNVASAIKHLHFNRFVRIVTKRLENSTKEIQAMLLCEGKMTACKICKDLVVDPVMLPCGCYVCSSTRADHADIQECPKCRTCISNITELQPKQLSETDLKQSKSFKMACSRFFLEYLEKFWFRKAADIARKQPKSPELSECIKSMLLKFVVRDENEESYPRDETECIDFFNNFGLDLVARSYIYHLVSQCHNSLAENELNTYFCKYGITSSQIDILMHCFSNCERNQLMSLDNAENFLSEFRPQDAKHLLVDCRAKAKELINGIELGQLQHLRFSIQLHLIVELTVLSIFSLHNNSKCDLPEDLMNDLIEFVCSMCDHQSFEVIKLAIVKILCKKHGLDAFNILVEHKTYQTLIPSYLVPENSYVQTNLYVDSDMLVLCGRNYINTKANLQRITHEKDFSVVYDTIANDLHQSKDSMFQIFLAISVWIRESTITKSLREKAFEKMPKTFRRHFEGKSYEQFFKNVSVGNIQFLKLDGVSDLLHYQLTELVVVYGATILWCRNGLLTELVGLMTTPEKYFKAFFPTMPESNYFKIKDIMSQSKPWYRNPPKSYLCPNGHLYFVGECTKPVESGTCPDCHQKIGGEDHKLHKGNREGVITEESQAGYKLTITDLNSPTTPERKLKKHCICIIRFCIHAAMLLASTKGNSIHRYGVNCDNYFTALKLVTLFNVCFKKRLITYNRTG